MGLVKLELRCPKTSAVVASPDPDPRWTWDDLFSELKSLEEMLGAPSSARPLPLKQSDHPDFPTGLSGNKPFVMCISDDDAEDSESDDEAGYDRSLVVAGTRFSCNDLDLSDSEDSDDELHPTTARLDLMDKKSPEEGILFELEFEHRLKVQEQLRNKLSALEAYQQNESERSSSAMLRLEKYTEARREMDRRLDKQYQRKIAEVLDKHLSVVQRNHEQRSQIEERRIRDDAALEEAKKKEKALQEKVRREKAKAEEEARLRAAQIAEEAKKAALEAEIRASKEAAEEEAARIREAAAAKVALKEAMEQRKAASIELISKETGLSSPKNMQLTGISVMAADAALKSEANRLKIYDEVAENYNATAQDFNRYRRKIDTCVRQISGSLENVKAKATALINIINNPECPRSISILLFAKKVVSLCNNPTGSVDTIAFACGHVILLLTSQVPIVMDFVLAEFHKACMYTVPKHLQPSQPTLNTKDFLKMIGYHEEDGKLESSESYLNRVRSSMKLYAALIQTEIEGIRNPHGLKEGWAWLARFLNALPANRSTAVALETFLKMAGFALYRRYGRQFRKILNAIQRRFLPALKERDPDAGEIIPILEKYCDLEMYEKEPEGRRLHETFLSNELHA